MKKRLWFIRHAQTPVNAAKVLQGSGIDSELSEKGVQQAHKLAERLKNEEIDLIITSTLKRAIQTSEIVKAFHPNVDIIKCHDLREISWGSWEGTSYGTESLPLLVQKWDSGYFDEKAPGGESPLETEQRSVNVIYDCIMNRKEKNIAFIVHGRLMRIMLSSILFRDLIYMSEFHHQNTTLNVIDVDVRIQSEEKSGLNGFIGSKPPNPVDIPKKVVDGRPSHIPQSSINHPDNVTFTPVVLCNQDHLTPDLT